MTDPANALRQILDQIRDQRAIRVQIEGDMLKAIRSGAPVVQVPSDYANALGFVQGATFVLDKLGFDVTNLGLAAKAASIPPDEH